MNPLGESITDRKCDLTRFKPSRQRRSVYKIDCRVSDSSIVLVWEVEYQSVCHFVQQIHSPLVVEHSNIKEDNVRENDHRTECDR